MFQSQNAFSVADLINTGLLLVAIIGIFLTYRQIREGYKTQKAAFFKDLYSTIFADEDIRQAFYRIEYKKFVYPKEFHGSETEKLIDRLLGFMDLVCDLYAQGVITDHEMAFFNYHFTRVYDDSNIQGYLEFLKGFYGGVVGTETGPFPSYVAYCEKKLRKRIGWTQWILKVSRRR
jgi:hypothetical protein